VTRRRWTFGAPRKSDKGRDRRHAGVDLYAPQGSVVLAPEAGTIVATQKFVWKDRHDAMLFQTDSGPVILFGEVRPRSWNDFGLSIGSHVQAGQPVARVGINPGGSQMLHYEMYTRGTRKNSRWYAGQAPPSNLLDPTAYLKTAKALDMSDDDHVEDDIVDDQVDDQVDDDHVDDDDDDIDTNTSTDPNIDPNIDPPFSNSPIAMGLLALGALLLMAELGDG
jgi:hypothetical protein